MAAVLSAMPCGPSFSAVGHTSGSPTPTPRKTYALTIRIDDGRSSVRQGDRLSYVTTVTNGGAAASPELEVSQTVPPGLALVSATPKAKLAGGLIVWNRMLPAGGSAHFTAVMKVEHLPERLRRLAAVACAATKAGKRPIVCASHMDLLPATAGAASARRTGAPILGPALRIAGVAALAFLGLGAFLWMFRRFRHRRPA